MTNELYWLVLSSVLTGILWIPYILNRLLEQGVLTAIWDPEGDTSTRSGWARRLMTAHDNAVENLAVFAPLVLSLHLIDLHTAITETACMVFFYSRLIHAVVFTLRVPVLRIVAFLGGFASQMILAMIFLGWLA